MVIIFHYTAYSDLTAMRINVPLTRLTAAIKQTASTLAWDMLQYYHGNETGMVPGILPGPPPAGDYYWWEGGAMWGTLIDYWHYTGDSTYNNLIMQSMQFQVGEGNDYMPSNYTASLGNDDQGFWGLSAMLAAEVGFPDPPSDKPQWLALAQSVFNTQASPGRHDGTCGGGIRWQIPFANNGYDYKNSIANGCFFNLGARLAHYTGNKTFSDWAEKTYDWVRKVGFIDAQNWAIYDGGHVEHDCKDINRVEFSYNNAVYMQGCAFMYSLTNDAKWEQCVQGLLKRSQAFFFKNGIAVEPACEFNKGCTTDMLSFKGYVLRWYAVVSQLVPSVKPAIMDMMQKSAAAAIKQCTGLALGRQCGFDWVKGVFDPQPGTGAGQEMNVLAATSALLVGKAKKPLTAKTGGTSKGDNNGGKDANGYKKKVKPITVADKAGAGIITFLILGSASGLFGWMSLGS